MPAHSSSTQSGTKQPCTIIVTGQTATGKTAAAIEIARATGGELISADARHLYRGCDIVTGKDRPPEDLLIHMIDVVDPNQTFSISQYNDAARPIIDEIHRKGKPAIIVGGTYYYIAGLLYGVPENPRPLASLRASLAQYTVPQLQDELKTRAPALFSRLNNSDRNNPHRLIRKIEIVHQQGSEATIEEGSLKIPGTVTIHGLRHRDREALVTAISDRVTDRIAAGALAETQRLLDEGYASDDPGLSAIGYRQMISLLRHEMTIAEAQEDWITKEVQYAKRQLTLMKRNPQIIWEENSLAIPSQYWNNE